jgi:hypothetical protein
MAFDDDEKALIEEEETHARRGACVTVLLFPPLVCCIIWAVLSLTPDGQGLVSRAYLYLTFYGIPIHNLTQGFPGIARASCELDQVNPRPDSYQSIQENYEAYYLTLVDLYRDSWKYLQGQEEDVSEYEDPERIPADLVNGRRFYCQ